MFTKNLSLFFPLLFLLHTFLNFNVVTATIRFQRRAAVDLGGFNTNAKRFAAGLTPNPPVRRWVPSRAEVARGEPSAVPVTRGIRVDLDDTTIGYVSQSLQDGHYFLVPPSDAGQFSTAIKSNGETVDINLKNQNSGLFLAGIIQSGLDLVHDEPTFARVGESQPTNTNDTPQSGKSPSLPGDAETAIWSYSANTNRLRAQWVNYNSGKPGTDIMYDFATNTFYLTDNPDGVADGHPLAVVVNFFYV